MKLSYITGAAAAVVLLSTAPAVAATNIVVNGGFETGPNVSTNVGYRTLKANSPGQSTAITGWKIGGNSIDYVSTFWQNNQNSGHSIALHGDGPGSIAQTLTTVVGQVYQIVFYFSASTNPVTPFPVSASANFGGTPAHIITVPTSPGNQADMNWRRGYFYRTATSTQTLLKFSAMGTGGLGVALDSISVSATPEPEAFASILVGLGLAGFVARRRRAKAALAAA